MNDHSLSCIAACITLCLAAGCQSDREKAQAELSRQIIERREGRERSLTLYNEAMAAHKAGKDDVALAQLREAVAVDDENAAAWMAIGILESEDGRRYEAAQAFRRATEIVPGRYEPHYNLGMLYESAELYDSAIEEYEIALDLDPDNIYVIENLARTYIQADRNLKQARLLLDRALEQEFRPVWRDWLRMESIRLDARLDQDAIVGDVAP